MTFKRPSVISCALIIVWGGYAGYCVARSYLMGPSTTFLHSHIRGATAFHAGDSITVDAISTRYQACKLEVFRFIRRVDNKSVMGDQEHQVDHVPQSFPVPSGPLETYYDIDLPNRLTPGEYELFSRSRYYCNGLDYIIPRYYETDHIPFTVIAREAP